MKIKLNKKKENRIVSFFPRILQAPNGSEEANVGAQPFRIVPFEELLEFAQVVSPDIDDAEEFDILRLKPSKPF